MNRDGTGPLLRRRLIVLGAATRRLPAFAPVEGSVLGALLLP